MNVSEETGEDSEQEEACKVTTAGRRSSIAGLKRKEIVALHNSLSWDRGTEGTLTISSILLNSVFRSKFKNKPLTCYTEPLQFQCRQTYFGQQRSNIIHR